MGFLATHRGDAEVEHVGAVEETQEGTDVRCHDEKELRVCLSAWL